MNRPAKNRNSYAKNNGKKNEDSNQQNKLFCPYHSSHVLREGDLENHIRYCRYAPEIDNDIFAEIDAFIKNKNKKEDKFESEQESTMVRQERRYKSKWQPSNYREALKIKDDRSLGINSDQESEPEKVERHNKSREKSGNHENFGRIEKKEETKPKYENSKFDKYHSTLKKQNNPPNKAAGFKINNRNENSFFSKKADSPELITAQKSEEKQNLPKRRNKRNESEEYSLEQKNSYLEKQNTQKIITNKENCEEVVPKRRYKRFESNTESSETEQYIQKPKNQHNCLKRNEFDSSIYPIVEKDEDDEEIKQEQENRPQRRYKRFQEPIRENIHAKKQLIFLPDLSTSKSRVATSCKKYERLGRKRNTQEVSLDISLSFRRFKSVSTEKVDQTPLEISICLNRVSRMSRDRKVDESLNWNCSFIRNYSNYQENNKKGKKRRNYERGTKFVEKFQTNKVIEFQVLLESNSETEKSF